MPVFALDLDHDGIRLLRKQSGVWAAVESVDLDDPQLPARMRSLRALAEDLSKGPLETELVIPGSQILYATLPDSGGDPATTEREIRAALSSLTPCPVDELVFDWRRTEDGLRVAALDINTLDEAEGFATTYGFNPVRFSARPAPESFPDTPDFGPTQAALREGWTDAPVVFTSRRGEVSEPGAPPLPEPAPSPGPPANENIFAAEPPQDTGRDAPEDDLPALPPASRADPPPRRNVRREAVTAVQAKLPRTRPERRKWAIVGAVAGAGAAGLAALVWIAAALVVPIQNGQRAPKPDETIPTRIAVPEDVQRPAAFSSESGMDRRPDTGQSAAILLPEAQTIPPGTMTARQAALDTGPGALDPNQELPDPSALASADVWQTPPPPPPDPVGETVDQLYLASIDPVVITGDAVALEAMPTDLFAFTAPLAPPQPDQVFDLDERGFVQATPEGAITPDGAVVTLGRPSLTPPARPVTVVLAADPAVALALAGKRPRLRPSDLKERMERAVLGGRTFAELATIRARARPESAQELAVASREQSPSALAVEVSRAPSSRPSDFASVVATVRSRQEAENRTEAITTAAASASAVVPRQPTIPSSASVSRQATIENAINLRRLNLIGVYGSEGSRRALVRLPSGRYQKVEVGDRLDGGRIDAIGDGELRYVKGGRNVVLRVPSG